ncbi:MAG: aldehyde dehydrogenase family protein [Nitrososphaerales archaeon]
MFKNELTYFNLLATDKESIFHTRYEEKLKLIGEELGKTYSMIIDGKRITQDIFFRDLSPIDARIIVARFPVGKEEDVIQAIHAAKRSFAEWSKLDYKERIRIFKKAEELMREKKYELATLLTYENGKNRYEAIAEVDEAIDFLQYYSYEMEINEGYIKQMFSVYPDERCYSVLKPYGVFAVIAPFNFPLAITTGMCSAAMITGNTVVLKPSSDTPLMAYKLCEILELANLPKGVINLVTGPGNIVGDTLIHSDKIDGVVFTGSKEVGLSIYSKANSKKQKPVITEMGGKNPAIVTPTANINKAVEGIAIASFSYSGQKCSACSLVYAHKKIYDEFVNRLIEFTSKLKVGNPIERDTFMGPLINSSAYEKYLKYINIARKDGKILFGGNYIVKDELRYGFYVEPTIVSDLKVDHEIMKKELFLPLLVVKAYSEFNEAINLCNDVEYGLTAGLYSNEKKEIEEFLNKIEAGVLYVNRARSATTGAMVGAQPFVGWKSSGISGKGAGGKYYLPLFMREQSQTICS